MKNKITRSVPFLVTQAGDAIAGMALYNGQLNLPHAVDADPALKLTNMIMADNGHKQGKALLKQKQAGLKVVEKGACTFIRVTRDVLKPVYGTTYSQAWDVTGLVGALEAPRVAALQLPVLQGIKGYMTATPLHEFPQVNVSAASATTHYDAVLAARNGVNHQKDEVGRLKQVRDDSAAAMEEALRTLLSELHVTLDPLDTRWVSFGFKMPGLLATPAIPQNLTAVLIGTNAISMKWNKAARASHYRVFKKVIGVDAEFVHVGSPGDLDFTIEGLPGNAQVEVLVSAVNNGGESQKSSLVLVQTL